MIVEKDTGTGAVTRTDAGTGTGCHIQSENTGSICQRLFFRFLDRNNADAEDKMINGAVIIPDRDTAAARSDNPEQPGKKGQA